jgi:hypothetical protein
MIGDLYADNFSQANGTRISHIFATYDDQSLRDKILSTKKL